MPGPECSFCFSLSYSFLLSAQFRESFPRSSESTSPRTLPVIPVYLRGECSLDMHMLDTKDSSDSKQSRPSGDSAQHPMELGDVRAAPGLYLQTVPSIPSYTVGVLRAESRCVPVAIPGLNPAMLITKSSQMFTDNVLACLSSFRPQGTSRGNPFSLKA